MRKAGVCVVWCLFSYLESLIIMVIIIFIIIFLPISDSVPIMSYSHTSFREILT